MGTCSTFTLGWLASNLSIQRFTTSCRLASFSICHSVRVIFSPVFASPPWLSAPPADTFEAVVPPAAAPLWEVPLHPARAPAAIAAANTHARIFLFILLLLSRSTCSQVSDGTYHKILLGFFSMHRFFRICVIFLFLYIYSIFFMHFY